MQLTKLQTLLSNDRIANIIRYSEMVKDMEGDVIEMGCFRCGILELLSQLHPDKTIFGIDTFSGLPAPTSKDNYHKEGDFKEVEYEAVKGYLRTMHRNVELRKGLFADVIPTLDPNKKYRFAHVDADLYQSVKEALDYLYPRMVDGGVILLDDFKESSTEGATMATLEFVSYLVKTVSTSKDYSISPRYCTELTYYGGGPSHKQYLIIR